MQSGGRDGISSISRTGLLSILSITYIPYKERDLTGSLLTRKTPLPGHTMISVRSQVFLTLIIISGSKAQVVFDNPPSGGETRTIAENISPGTSLYGLQATDLAGNMPFFIIANSSCVSTPTPSSIPTFTISSSDQLLVPTGGLDAENCTQFEFTFSVTAGSSTAISGPLTLIVTDVNDVDPLFTKASYNGEVWKNDQQYQTVNANDLVSATDPDKTNLSIIYSIAGAQTTFAIYDNGSVYVQTPSGLASLSSPTTLTIQASDGGRTSTASLIIIVHDDPCTNSPCQNGGTCTEKARGIPACACLSGYTGSSCSQVDYCLTNYCQNNASCDNMANGYKCKCLPNYERESQNCTILDHCYRDPCNGKCCVNNTNDFTCICGTGFMTGRTCNQLKICLILGVATVCFCVLICIFSIGYFIITNEEKPDRNQKYCTCDKGGASQPP